MAFVYLLLTLVLTLPNILINLPNFADKQRLLGRYSSLAD
jgi:hypothetical protein